MIVSARYLICTVRDGRNIRLPRETITTIKTANTSNTPKSPPPVCEPRSCPSFRPRQPLIPLTLQIPFHLLEFHVNGIIRDTLFCSLGSVAQRDYVETHHAATWIGSLWLYCRVGFHQRMHRIPCICRTSGLLPAFGAMMKKTATAISELALVRIRYFPGEQTPGREWLGHISPGCKTSTFPWSFKTFQVGRFNFYSVRCRSLAFSLSSVADGIFAKMDTIVSPIPRALYSVGPG